METSSLGSMSAILDQKGYPPPNPSLDVKNPNHNALKLTMHLTHTLQTHRPPYQIHHPWNLQRPLEAILPPSMPLAQRIKSLHDKHILARAQRRRLLLPENI